MNSFTVDRSTASKRKVDDSFDIEGMVFPLLKAIVTTCPSPRTKISFSHEQQKDYFLKDIVEVTVENELLAKEDHDSCQTPRSKEHKIPEVLECPPAPIKPKPEQKKKTANLPEGFFFVPPDLDSAFLLYRISPPKKKMHSSNRVSALAVGQNGGHRMWPYG